ncbi:MAG: 4-deoxy-4-formamido-L-arabinose-phosphoundecaprenol deformylase, partial [Lentisphaeria bacterium]|nr:4-deoxy-4-formamido-L-arabinose-phosphoundecaprenol deformylase [Lentisphaeria bacterium]
MKIALRIDVDTFRGTRDGVPTLCRILDKHGIRAAFFFSAGPDNMGRHIWRLLKPAFLWKMLRTKAASLYGLDILLMGTMWPGPRIGKRLGHVIRACSDAGHEIGVHAWDHQAWQARIDRMNNDQIENHLRMAFEELERVTG